MKFIERTSAPTENTKYYKTNNPFFPTYSMFRNNGNCTDYCYFRFKEANQMESCKLPTNNAESWMNKNTEYKTGSTPKVGAVGVYAKGQVGNPNDGAGHVLFVERVNSDGSILVSESGWKSFIWRTRTLQPPYSISGYRLLGFIYSPNEFEVDTPAPVSYTYTQFVKDVQSSTGAKVDGIAGKETLSKTITISKSKNNKHSVVRAVQKYLISLGYDLGTYGADGIFGNATDKAVKLYQKNNGCVQDGEITARCKTWKKLLKLI